MIEEYQYLRGDITEDQVVGWDETTWRCFQFRHMVMTNKRLSGLENQSSWKAVVGKIPWAIVGALIVALVKNS